MPYALQPEEDIAAGLRRIAGEQAHRGIDALDRGLADSGAGDADRREEDAWDEAVHDARKRCKKIRAVARLGRDALGDAYSPVNAAFRDTARLLSGARDAWTLVETCDLLAARDDDDLLPAGSAAALRDALVARYRGVRAQTTAEGRLAQARDALLAAAEGISDWPLPDGMDADALTPSVARVYGRGLDRWSDVRGTLGEDPHATTEDWHEWRKRAKYLWYHVRLLEESWPDVLGGWEDALDDLGDALGDDHDLGVLVDLVRREALVDPGITEQVAGAAAAQRHALRGTAADIAARVYVEPPDALAGRLTTYLATVRA